MYRSTGYYSSTLVVETNEPSNVTEKFPPMSGFGIFALCTIIGSLSATVGLEASDDQLKVVKGDNGMFLLHKMNFYRAAQEYENMVVFFDGPGVPLTMHLDI